MRLLANPTPDEHKRVGEAARRIYLLRVVHVEAEAGQPPLTAIVACKSSGSPGDAFLRATHEIGLTRTGEHADDVWRRAVAAVDDYWRGRA
jgi:hypothetical protein